MKANLIESSSCRSINNNYAWQIDKICKSKRVELADFHRTTQIIVRLTFGKTKFFKTKSKFKL